MGVWGEIDCIVVGGQVVCNIVFIHGIEQLLHWEYSHCYASRPSPQPRHHQLLYGGLLFVGVDLSSFAFFVGLRVDREACFPRL